MYETDRDKVLSEIEPLLADLADAFDLAVVQTTTIADANFPNASDGYLRSTIIRAFVKEYLYNDGYSLARVANVGIEVIYEAKYAVKVVRSDHAGDAPAPATISRASWYAANQPRLSVNGMDAEAFWSIKRLGLPGCDVDEAILGSLGSQDDGHIHLIVDWQEDSEAGTVQIAVSMPTGAWRPNETPKLAWRSIYERGDEDGKGFVPTDEDIDFFVDDEDGDTMVGAIVG